MSRPGFYHAFEELYRGSRSLIKERLHIYLPFIEPFRQIYVQCTAIDLGCGRGEWLELLQKNGFKAHGVDLDESMLAVCAELKLNATRQEAIEYLQSLDDQSQCIVSGFHFAEHISFNNLRVLVAEALRVLQPGGLLILETPNPENVVVGTTNFYLDPTHQRPIPPLLMSFLAEYQGFGRVKILRLQESPKLATQEDIELSHVFSGVSPDYAIVAQKGAEPEILLRFSAAFDKHYGIRLEDLANRYDARIDRRISALDQRVGNAEVVAGGVTEALSRISVLQDRLIDATTLIEQGKARTQEQEQRSRTAESRAQEQEQRARTAESCAQEQEQRARTAESRAQEAESRAQEQEQRSRTAESRIQEQQKRIDELNGNVHHWWTLANATETREKALRQSLSWKITAPLRVVLDGVKTVWHLPFKFNFDTITSSLNQGIRWGMQKPKLVAMVHLVLKPFPALKERITRRVGRAVDVIPVNSINMPSGLDKPDTLSADTARVLRDLKLSRGEKETRGLPRNS